MQLCFIRIENNWRVFHRDEIFAVLNSENLILQVVISASLPDWPETKINTLPLINVKATHVNAHPDTFLSISFGLNILPCYSLRGRWIEFLSLCVICYLLSYITTTYGPLSLDLIDFLIFEQMSLTCKDNLRFLCKSVVYVLLHLMLGVLDLFLWTVSFIQHLYTFYTMMERSREEKNFYFTCTLFKMSLSVVTAGSYLTNFESNRKKQAVITKIYQKQNTLRNIFLLSDYYFVYIFLNLKMSAQTYILR